MKLWLRNVNPHPLNQTTGTPTKLYLGGKLRNYVVEILCATSEHEAILSPHLYSNLCGSLHVAIVGGDMVRGSVVHEHTASGSCEHGSELPSSVKCSNQLSS
jgi:hypothetical protein